MKQTVRVFFMLIFIISVVPLWAKENDSVKLYIKGMKLHKSLKDREIASEIKDYMAEEFVKGSIEGKRISLITDDEVKHALSNMEFAQALGNDDEAGQLVNRINQSIEVDYLVYGSVSRTDNGHFIINARLLRYTDNGIQTANMGDVEFVRRIYVDRASRALAKYLMIDREKNEKKFLFKEEPIEDFHKDIARLENEIRALDQKLQQGTATINKRTERRNTYIKYSPRWRLGFGRGSLIQMGDENLNSLYSDGGTAITLDFYPVRSKDPVGNGVDLYLRSTLRQFEMPEGSFNDISPDSSAGDYIGRYTVVPTSATMTHLAGDIGVRFVGTTYFFMEAWSAYLSVAARYMWVREEYSNAANSYKDSFLQWGVVSGIGLEVSLTSAIGLFTEGSWGYVPVGKDDINADGFNLIYGVTYRTNHWW